jgi:hypothetical protein
MADSLVKQHPDVARISWKWGRPQHHVDYSRFQDNELRRKPGLIVPDGVNNFGMAMKPRSRTEPRPGGRRSYTAGLRPTT